MIQYLKDVKIAAQRYKRKHKVPVKSERTEESTISFNGNKKK
jgi:hypothetical protein